MNGLHFLITPLNEQARAQRAAMDWNNRLESAGRKAQANTDRAVGALCSVVAGVESEPGAVRALS